LQEKVRVGLFVFIFPSALDVLLQNITVLPLPVKCPYTNEIGDDALGCNKTSWKVHSRTGFVPELWLLFNC